MASYGIFEVMTRTPQLTVSRRMDLRGGTSDQGVVIPVVQRKEQLHHLVN
jgi:hypothetical protein